MKGLLRRWESFNKLVGLFSNSLSLGQTIEQSWIQHPTLLDVNVEIVAKHYPALLDETSYRYKLAQNFIQNITLLRKRKALI